MCVPDLHPEDLLERDLGGVLSPTERAHLDAHLERCAACRFERLTRGDFAALRADEAPTQPTVPLAGPRAAAPGHHGYGQRQVNRP